jgi:hypothetical protein
VQAVEILPVQETIVLRARGSELLILPHHVRKLKGLTKPKDFSQYFHGEALVNRPARKLFEAWLRKDQSLWTRLYTTVHKEMEFKPEGAEDAAEGQDAPKTEEPKKAAKADKGAKADDDAKADKPKKEPKAAKADDEGKAGKAPKAKKDDKPAKAKKEPKAEKATKAKKDDKGDDKPKKKKKG